GLQAGILLSATALVEVVFSWPGIGSLMVESILTRDLPVTQGCVLAIAAVYAFQCHRRHRPHDGGPEAATRMSASTSVASVNLGRVADARSATSSGTWQRVWGRLRHDPVGLAGIALVLIIVLLAILAPVVAPGDPTATQLTQAFRPAGTPGHWLGTDLYGRDIL